MKKVKEEAPPATSIGNASVDLTPGIRQKVVVDRRYDPKKHPKYLKSFSKYLEGK